MKNKKQEKIILTIIFILILIVQILAIIYATRNREYYHIDEYYSHGLMQYKRAFIYENEDFIDNWHNKEYYKDYLTIDENEKFDFSKVYENQVEDVHPPIYYFLLRIACTFNIGEFSIWPGTILNIIIFIISSTFLFLIAKEIFKNSYYALLVCFVTGFSLAVIETVMYVRMYELLVLNILMLIYWHIKKAGKEELTFKDLIPLYLMIIFGFLTHYYYCIILATLCVIYTIKYVKKKEYKSLLKYFITLIASALTGILIFPQSIKHIFFSYRGQEVTHNLFECSTILEKIGGNIRLINNELFHNYLYVIEILGIVLCIAWVLSKKKNEKVNSNNYIKYVIIPMFVYLVVAIIGSPYIDLRYIMPVVPLVFCTLIYIAWDMLRDLMDKKKSFCVILVLCMCFSISVIPKLSNNLYTYKGHKEVLNYMENEIRNKPMIYIYEDLSAQYNKIMECYEALTKMENTYIMSVNKFSIDNIKNALKSVDTTNKIAIMIHNAYGEDALKLIMNSGVFESVKFVGTLGRYCIYEFK